MRTDAGSVVGTVDYMSPEQARGQPVDARTDVWSLGVLLYELVAGRRPFAGQSSSEVLAGILEHEPAPLARFEPDAPHELQRIVGKALRKDREQRYQVMKDLLLDLQALRDDVAGQARSGRVEDQRAGPVATPTPPSAPASTGVTPRSQSSAEYVVTGLARHKVAAALVAGILALIAGGCVVGGSQSTHRQRGSPKHRARPANAHTSDLRVGTADGRDVVARRTVHRVRVRQGRQLRHLGPAGRRR